MEGLRKFGRYTPERNVFPIYYDWRLSARVKLGGGSSKVDHLILVAPTAQSR